MAFYIRKIAPGKWPQKGDAVAVEDIRADAVTGDIRTTGDTISLWRIDSLEDLDQAVLALASGNDKAVTHNVLAIPEEILVKYGFSLKETQGDTPAEALRDTHWDVIGVTYGGLGRFVQLAMDSINADALHTVTRKRVKALILDAYQNGELNRDKLKEKMTEEIEAELKKKAG